MIASDDSARHEEAWLSLPWLANGRLSQAEREKIEPHVRTCAACREELAFQRLLCNVLTEPDRVTYAPGPSFRKLVDRIDGAVQPARESREPNREPNKAPATPAARRRNDSHLSTWRPPGLAWAATFILAIGLGGVATTIYRSSQPLYVTHTEVTHGAMNVLHIAFDRAVTVGEAEEVLRANGARVVEGPDSTGIIGVTPMNRVDMHVLATRLHADPRVRWVEPVPADDAPPPRGS
jgi:Putative zinc-finger